MAEEYERRSENKIPIHLFPPSFLVTPYEQEITTIVTGEPDVGIARIIVVMSLVEIQFPGSSARDPQCAILA